MSTLPSAIALVWKLSAGIWDWDSAARHHHLLTVLSLSRYTCVHIPANCIWNLEEKTNLHYQRHDLPATGP